MRRRGVSSNMNNVVHSGWMIKSPPERKLNAPFKIFRSQWKRRYFVLRKPFGSLPDQYELRYYKDEKCNYKKGSIDLEQCEQIIESLDSELFQYLLAIKTVCKNKVRTYYLAADSEQDMGSWVQWLCHVCGMKQEVDHIPEPRPPSISSTPVAPVSNGRPWSHSSVSTTSPSSATAASTTVQSLTPNVAVSQPVAISQRVPSSSSIDSSPSYIPLDNCTTGKPQRVDRTESVESVPDFTAPSPPMPRGVQQDTGCASGNEDDVFVTGSYQRTHKPKEPAPPPRSAASLNLYLVPPVRPPKPGQRGDDSDEDRHNYDIPPPRRGQSPKRSSVSNDSRKDSFSSSGHHNPPSEFYDYPPPRLSSTTSSDCDVSTSEHQPSPYQNIPSTNKSTSSTGSVCTFDLNTVVPPPRPHQANKSNLGYDIPRASKHTSQIPQSKLSTVIDPLPPRPVRPSQAHAYLNTQGEGPGDKDTGSTDYFNISATPPAIPPPRHNSTNSDLHDGIYNVPPPSSASASSTPPPRPPARTGASSQTPPPIAARNPDSSSQSLEKGEDGGVIFSTHRTRSFKKQHNIHVSIKSSNKANTLPMTAPVPAPRPVQHSKPSNHSSSEDGDEETTHHPISLLRSVPPPTDPEPELKYIDLELPDTTVLDPPKSLQSHHSHHGHHSHHNHTERTKPDSSIEYREIDFVKTKALKETKKEKDRQNDDHNA